MNPLQACIYIYIFIYNSENFTNRTIFTKLFFRVFRKDRSKGGDDDNNRTDNNNRSSNRRFRKFSNIF